MAKPRKKRKAKVASQDPSFIAAGRKVGRIDVRLSYRIIELFSEGLYSSANKTFEELVTNSFDAGARNVNVLLPADPTAQDATIVVVDDGEGMNAAGLEELWQIGVSRKRSRTNLPQNRNPIGKFGIGKLATYVLANNLTYISKKDGKFFATTMDYRRVSEGVRGEVAPKKPLALDVRRLTEAEAIESLRPWMEQKKFSAWKISLFGDDAAKNWTFAILSSLKDKANEIEPGRLGWILSTALPLRDDFSIFLDGTKLIPSKHSLGRVGTWILGKEIAELQKPAPDELSVRLNKELPTSNFLHYGLYHPQLGRVTGYADGFKDVLTTGKSSELGRSYGFFVYVRGRLVNIEDEYFGIDSNLLKHGVFSRFRLVVNIDELDRELRSTREAVRDGPLAKTARNILHAIFNHIRPKIESDIESETPAARLSRKLEGSPASLSRRPIINLVRLALSGKASPRYLRLPANLDEAQKATLISDLEKRSESGAEFVRGVHLTEELSPDAGIAVFDIGDGQLKINALHPFVGAFSDDYSNASKNFPLQLLALAEVLLEAQLFDQGFEVADLKSILDERDQLLRFLGRSSGRRTALMVAQALRDARNDENLLEDEVVASFNSLGFEANRIGGKGNADGIAVAHLSPEKDGKERRYSVSLEAKSKESDGAKVSAKAVGVSSIVRQRDKLNCQHAVVVGPDFPTTEGEESALAQEIATANKDGKTITLIRIDDFAQLVKFAPLKQIGPSRLRDLFQTCTLPQQAKEWIDKATSVKPVQQPYKEILEAIWTHQKKWPSAPVQFAALRVQLDAKGITKSDSELQELCRAMATLAPGRIMQRDHSVELEVPPERVLEAIESATKQYAADEKKSP